MKFKVIIVSIACSLLISGGFLYNRLNASENNAVQDNIIQYHTRETYDYNIPEELVGAHHNVFIGKINSKVQNDDSYYKVDDDMQKLGAIGIPVSTYSVTPIYNIKGNLDFEKDIYLEEAYAYSDELNKFVSMINREPIQIGNTYLIFARSADEDRISFDGHKILTAGTAPETVQKIQESMLRGNLSQNNAVKFYLEAYQNEVPLYIDVQNGINFNAYDDKNYLC